MFNNLLKVHSHDSKSRQLGCKVHTLPQVTDLVILLDKPSCGLSGASKNKQPALKTAGRGSVCGGEPFKKAQ